MYSNHPDSGTSVSKLTDIPITRKFNMEVNLMVLQNANISININLLKDCHMLSFCQIKICHIFKNFFVKFYSHHYFCPYNIGY